MGLVQGRRDGQSYASVAYGLRSSAKARGGCLSLFVREPCFGAGRRGANENQRVWVPGHIVLNVTALSALLHRGSQWYNERPG